MPAVLFLLIVAFGAFAAPIVRAQEGTSPTSRTASAPSDTRPAEDPIESAVRDLLKSVAAGEAGIRAAQVYALGDAARARLVEILKAKGTTDVVFEGVVSAFDVQGDPAVAPTLFDLYGRGNPVRDVVVAHAVRRFDQRSSLLPQAAEVVEKATDVAERRRALRLFAETCDDPADRLRGARRLVLWLTEKRFELSESDVLGTLQRVTFHEFPDAASWKEWLDAAEAQNPTGLAEAALYRSALREKDRRFLQEVQRAVDVAIGEKRAPVRFLEAKRYPEVVIRRYAAASLGKLAGGDADLVRRALEALLTTIEDDPDYDTVASALDSAAALAGKDAEAAPRVATAARKALLSSAPIVVVSALKAIASAGDASALAELEALYVGLASRDDMVDARVELLKTLYTLEGGAATLTQALRDGSTLVRAAAARTLGAARRTTAAPAIAAALAVETGPEPQLAMVRALNALDTWDDAGVAALLGAVRSGSGLVRDGAVRGLLLASAAPTFPPGRMIETVAAIADAAPGLVTSEDKRALLLADLKPNVVPHVDVAIRWLKFETDLVAAREIATRLAKIGSDFPERLADTAAALKSGGRREAAPILLRAAYGATTAATATASRRAVSEDYARLLAEALVEEGAPEGLTEAEDIAKRALAARPDDARFLLVRGAVYEMKGEHALAAKDLTAALKSAGADLGDARRDVERRILVALAKSGDVPAAQAFLASLPAGNRGRAFLIAAAEVELAAGRRKEAVAHLRNAMRAEGTAPLGAVEFRLAQLLIASPWHEDRDEAGKLVDAFEATPTRVPRDVSIVELVNLVRLDRRGRVAVAALDAADDATRPSRVKDVADVGPSVAPRLIEGIDRLAAGGAGAAVGARLSVLKSLFANDEALQSVADPAVDASPAELTEVASRTASWWDRRSR